MNSCGVLVVFAMLGVVHTNVLSCEWVGCKSYVGGNRREGPNSPFGEHSLLSARNSLTTNITSKGN